MLTSERISTCGYHKQIRKFIEEGRPVFIRKTDERGEFGKAIPEYAIVAANSGDYWLNAYKTLKLARKYCRRLGLKVIKEENQ